MDVSLHLFGFGAQQLGGFRTPELDLATSAVGRGPGGGQRVAVGGKRRAADGAGVADETDELSSGGHVPEFMPAKKRSLTSSAASASRAASRASASSSATKSSSPAGVDRRASFN